MNQLLTDLRFGVRMLFKYPTLSLVAILTLGLGIGLSTVVFCVVNGALYKGLPFPNADRIVAVMATNVTQNETQLPINDHDYAVWEARQTSFEKFGAYNFVPMNLANDDGRPERYRGAVMTVGAFEALGVEPLLGRGFREGDDKPGAAPIVVIGRDLWRDRFNGSPSIVGTSIRVNGVHRSVVGVMPEQFAFPIREQLWTPLVLNPHAKPRGQGESHQVIARLKPGVTLREAKTQAAAVAAQLANEFPATNRGIGGDVVPYALTEVGPEIYALLYTMLGAGVGVLLIACNGISRLVLANRTYSKSLELSKLAEINGLTCSVARVEEAKAMAKRFDLVVNATSVGLQSNESILDSEDIDGSSTVYDLVYRPVMTKLLENARAKGATIIYGYEMLLEQGAQAFEIWTGIKAPILAMKKALFGVFQEPK